MQRTKQIPQLAPIGLLACLCACVLGCPESDDPNDRPAGRPVDTTGGHVDVTGRFTYDSVPPTTGSGLAYGSTIRRPGRGLLVEAVATNGATLDSTTTNDDGSFDLDVDSTRSFYLRVKAQLLRSGTPSWNFRVVDNTSSGALYFFRAPSSAGSYFAAGDTGPFDLNAASGWGGSDYDFARDAAPFAIIDVVRNGVDLVLGADPSAQFPPLDVNWSIDNRAVYGDPANGNIGTSFFSGHELYILGDENNDTDEYDTHVVAHELGHYFEAFFSRSDSVGGSHSATSFLDARVAFGEGFGNAFSGMVQGSAVYIDTFGVSQSSLAVVSDLDDNFQNEAKEGWWNEISVQAILYDLFDASDDGADTLGLGFPAIYSVLTGPQRDTDSFTTLLSFVSHLKAENGGSAAAIDALVGGEGVSSISDEWDADGSVTTIASFGPLYTPIPIDGGATQLCGTDDDGHYNRRLNRRYFYFEVTTQGNVTIDANASGGSDPVVVLYHRGARLDSANAGQENQSARIQRSLSPGFYTGEVYHSPHIWGTANIGTRCIDVSIAQ